MGKRRFTPEFKVQVVLELFSGSKSTAQVCREQRLRRIFDRLAQQVVSAWRQHFLKRATDIFSTPESERVQQ